MYTTTQSICPELTWLDGVLRPNVRIDIDAAGHIRSVTSSALPPPTVAAKLLPRRALLPGFVNVHSHAFQRALRGHGESYPAGMGDFWSWREAMYDLVLRLTPDELRRVTRLAFEEMLAAGFTTVGEFHYVHHREIERLDYLLDDVIIETAAEVGIRLVLLQCYYRTGGVGRPLAGGQLRFSTPDVDAFMRQTDALAKRLDPATQTIGLAPHSLRAVPTDDLRTLHAIARERGWVCHTHVEEQRKEIDEFRAVHGCMPLEWMLDNLDIGDETTIVHATHSTPAHLKRYLDRGANICVCPITEGNLGDGLAQIVDVDDALHRVCIGTDSNVRIDAAEELRWLEFVQRLRRERRGVYKDDAGEVTRRLIDCGTRAGARALGIAAGEIAVGKLADFILIDLDHPSIRGKDEAGSAALIFGGSGAAIDAVCVGGRWRALR
ncbi:MAG: formimidoylglutamate deiminase [Phycisphaerae bacterium]